MLIGQLTFSRPMQIDNKIVIRDQKVSIWRQSMESDPVANNILSNISKWSHKDGFNNTRSSDPPDRTLF